MLKDWDNPQSEQSVMKEVQSPPQLVETIFYRFICKMIEYLCTRFIFSVDTNEDELHKC